MTQKSKAASLTGELLAPKGAATPAPSLPHMDDGQPATVPSDDSEVAKIGAPAPEGDEPHTGGIQFPLRLDPAEHLELRMAAARSGMTCQEIIAAALTRYLAELAAQEPPSEAPAKPKKPKQNGSE